MGSWPNWKDLKKSAKLDPERVEDLRRGVERGGKTLAERLAGPAAHLRNVGQEFKAGYTHPEATHPEATHPETAHPEAGAPEAPAAPEPPAT